MNTKTYNLTNERFVKIPLYNPKKVTEIQGRKQSGEVKVRNLTPKVRLKGMQVK